MKRDASLYALSWDHQHGLALARDILLRLGGEEKSGRELARKARDFWKAGLRYHFLVEERDVFPLAADGGKDCREDLEKLRAEHGAMRATLRRLPRLKTRRGLEKNLRAFAVLLREHIRYEERTFFPRLEALLGEDGRKTLGALLRRRYRARYPGLPS